MKIAPITIALAIIFSFLVWGRHTENIDVFIGTSLPAGQRFYLISKLSALVALAILFVQISLMLFKRYVPAGRRIVWPQRSHQLLGIVTFVLVLIHSISFITAASFRSGAPAFSLLLPNFQTGLYNTAVSLGLLAFYLFLLLVPFGFIARSGGSLIRRIHRWLVWLALLCVMIHSVAIGSESKTWPMIVFYCLFACLLLWLLYRKNIVQEPTKKHN